MAILTPALLGRLLQLVPRDTPAPQRYVGALVLVGLAIALRLQLPVAGVPYLLFIPFLMTAAFWLGLGPGLLASVTAMLAAEWLFVGNAFSLFTLSQRWVANGLFLLLNILLTLVCVTLRRSLESLHQFAGTLGREVEVRTLQRDQIWRASPDMLCTATLDGHFVELNPLWTTLLGWTPAELHERPLLSFIHPEDRLATQEAMAILGQGQPVFGFENRYQNRDGSYRWFSWNAVLRDGLIYATVREVTAIREQQAALQRAEELLRQSQKMDAVGQLTGGIAHDFNNLLTGVIGSLDMIELRVAQGRTNDLPRYLSTAKGAAERAAALTHRLLAFSRQQTLDPRPTSCNTLVLGMQELIRHSLTPQIELHLALMADLHVTLCDPHQLENALLNLCINARDAMPDGGQLRIVTANRTLDEEQASDLGLQPGDYVTLAVEDSGTGMPPDVLARACDPFFTTKPIGAGTGLGLSMIYGFTKQSGGLAHLSSAPGQGTTVTLFLPRLLGIQPKTPGPALPLPPLPLAEGRQVLVVDDEPSVRLLVSETLRDQGFHILEAADGTTALQRIEAHPQLELLIADIGLPGGLNGRQLAEAARLRQPDLPVLLITGYAESAVIGEQPLVHGMAILTKPFSMDRLLARVRDLLEATAH